jgi:hypothetical protein
MIAGCQLFGRRRRRKISHKVYPFMNRNMNEMNDDQRVINQKKCLG